MNVSFRGVSRKMDSAKDAYVWLISQFHKQKDDIFDLYNSAATNKRGRVDFAHSEQDLFLSTPELAGKGGYCSRIPGTAWYANTHTQTAEKKRKLEALAEIGGFVYGIDWTWG